MEKELQMSIILPVYNTEKYLKECLDSILNQGLTNYEILIVNDGSTDESQKIINWYVETYPFIEATYQENHGQSAARNKALETAKGKYIYFMDSDDYLEHNSLGELYEKAEKNKLEAVFFDGKSFIDTEDEGNNYKLLNKFNYSRHKNYGLYEFGEHLMADLSKDNKLFVSPCLYLVKKEVLEKNKLKFPEGIKHEDEFFTINLFLYINRCIHVNKVYFMRRIRQNSTMTALNKSNSLIGYAEVLTLLDEVYSKHMFKTRKSKKAFKKKIEQNYKSALVTYNKIYEKENFTSGFWHIQYIGKKYKYFNIQTIIFMFLVRNKKIYSFFRENE